MNLIPNERTTYLATLLDTVAATAIGAGVVVPLVALSYGVPGSIIGGAAILVSLAWLATGPSDI